jgi:hypothetical protein
METTDYPYMSNTKASIKLLGHPSYLSPFAQFTSASRANMFASHCSQVMTLDNPEFTKIFTGGEYNLLQHTINGSRREHDCEILKIIPKYQPSFLQKGIDDCPVIYVLVLNILPNGERELDYFTIDRYMMGTNGFGYVPIEQNKHRIVPGEILDKDTPITHSPHVSGNQYRLGTNLNVILGSFPEVVEDAFIISESAAKKLQTTEVSQVVIDCRQDRRPMNINGDEYEDKFLPDIGSYVRDDGALCAFRPVHWATCIADTEPESLREPLPLQDDVIYVEPHSKIVDITFNVNRNKINDCYDQALQYMRNNTKCWEDIYSTYLKFKGKIKLSKKMNTLVTTAIYRMIAQGARVPNLEADFRKEMKNFDIEGAKGQTVDFLQAVVTYTHPRLVSKGDKLSDSHGG